MSVLMLVPHCLDPGSLAVVLGPSRKSPPLHSSSPASLWAVVRFLRNLGPADQLDEGSCDL